MNRQTLRNAYPFHNTQPYVSVGYNPKRDNTNRFSQVMARILIYGTSSAVGIAVVLSIAHSVIRAFAA
ncbi:hypothetical protein ACN9MB_09040 [Dyella kyungheensis]|uniref:hypothetical protein n=1 Tax=Dyella kyungheensis TaxID=1242174 RepID=UPI003CF99BB3